MRNKKIGMNETNNMIGARTRMKVLKLIHVSLVSMLVMAFLAVWYLMNVNFFGAPEWDIISIVIMMVPVVVIFIGNLLYKIRLKSAPKDLTEEGKVSVYQTACLVRWALIEAGAIMVLVLGNDFKFLAAFLILVLVFLRPSKMAMDRDLRSSKLVI